MKNKYPVSFFFFRILRIENDTSYHFSFSMYEKWCRLFIIAVSVIWLEYKYFSTVQLAEIGTYPQMWNHGLFLFLWDGYKLPKYSNGTLFWNETRRVNAELSFILDFKIERKCALPTYIKSGKLSVTVGQSISECLQPLTPNDHHKIDCLQSNRSI